MARLEDLAPGATVKGILPNEVVTIIDVKSHGSSVIEVVYKDTAGHVANELLFRERESALEVVTPGRGWNLEVDGEMVRLVSEAMRIRLAHLFDPMLAVHTSMLEPLPHQITGVYGEMLTRQPLRFLLADDPGSGKTIMAGLLIRELIIRGDVRRCLVVCPGNLVDQWQDELYRRFQLPFQILTNDAAEASVTGNYLAETPLVIARLDKMARDEVLQGKLAATEWDLVVCDEAHKMSASFFGREVKETKRYKLGKILSGLTRHFLLMTATPHNGKEEDFQLFMALLDGDRFEGRFRDGVHSTDVSDLMRRMVKEQLLKFDGTPLFPERRAYTVAYQLTDAEAELYAHVTQYVREEFNRADALENEGRRGTVGFALTILQRRLASSPEAIYQSLRRRRERLERRLRQEELLRRGAEVSTEHLGPPEVPEIGEDQIESLDEAPSEEVEALEETVVDQASAARTISELRAEIGILAGLEVLAGNVRQSGTDRKWDELSKLLQSREAMFDLSGNRRKLIIFTEHRDTLNYLAQKIRSLIGRAEAVVIIHGGMGRQERAKAQEAFTQDPQVHILVATDAAGEGINLQRAHLMVNYDLPWNPNRIEQRFGRIHRIGQTEVCHLWNLVAEETREGDVYLTLLRKLETERQALGAGVFDVLGKAINGVELRSLLLDAIRYGDDPEVKARLTHVVEQSLDTERLRSLIEERALASDSMDLAEVRRIREDMERVEARRLQPHFIESFFLKAFSVLGGTVREREYGRYEIAHVPSAIRGRDWVIGAREAVLMRYERICFEKELTNVAGKPLAALVCPGHPLLDITIDLILERHRSLLKEGGVLVDDNDPGESPRWLFYLEHSIRDSRFHAREEPHIVSRRMQFVAIGPDGGAHDAGYAPYLDYRPLRDDEKAVLASGLDGTPSGADMEAQAVSYAIQEIVPKHYEEVRGRRQELVDKTIAAVKDRLTKEINYWDHRAAELKMQELAGKPNAKINSGKARQRADELQTRLQKRIMDLGEERNLSPLPPSVLGGVLVVPKGLLDRMKGAVQVTPPDQRARDTGRVEMTAMQAVMGAEAVLGHEPADVSAENCGYDVESRIPGTGHLRFIEVKGRAVGAPTVTVTKNEILTALNKPEDFILALVEVEGDSASSIRYVMKPFQREPDFGVTSVNYGWGELWDRGEEPDGQNGSKKETD
jgi:superfamily II DNA or RNA helicase